MFATLVICLPSKHEGGQLIVSHAGRSLVVDFSGKTSNYELQYAAFYADCEHEVRPVTDGYRICLIYNLITGRRSKQPAAPEFSDAIESATRPYTLVCTKTQASFERALKQYDIDCGLLEELSNAHSAGRNMMRRSRWTAKSTANERQDVFPSRG